jgi:tRNA(Ile)-lysidine synthase
VAPALQQEGMGLSLIDLDLTSYAGQSAVAVGVSGGPDSMALAWLLKDWAAAQDIFLHLITVDHGLRSESAAEARMVRDAVKDWPNTTHVILRWGGDKPGARVLEEARTARYALMRDYCAAQNISYLFIAHHQDDQAETFLMRLAKGSGLDGLAGMKVEQDMASLVLVRPLLSVSKSELVAFCDQYDIPYVRDPTNDKTDYMRPRLRAARAVLEEEGMSAKRLATTAMRLARARAALETYAGDAYTACVCSRSDVAISFHVSALKKYPEDIVLRVLLRAMGDVRVSATSYPPRLEKVEGVAGMFMRDALEKTTTLGGCLFVPDAKNDLLWVKGEQ